VDSTGEASGPGKQRDSAS